jgi:SHS family lactate transporter-like MFS transporter
MLHGFVSHLTTMRNRLNPSAANISIAAFFLASSHFESNSKMDDAHKPVVAEGHRAALFAGFLGWTLDAFDFFLVGLSLTAIAAEFHKTDADIALSITLTLGFRPVGAFIFGLLADRYGRRLPLMLDLVFYSVIEVLSGLAPNYASFMVLRALFGIGMGGEWGVGASLAMEKVPPRLRGVLSGLLQEGYAAGYLLAAGCYFFVFPRWGWRPMFFIGGLPALLAIFVRFHVKESEVWRKTRHESWGKLGRAIASHWRLFIYLVLLMMMMNFVSHGTQDMYPTLLKRAWGFGPQKVALVTAFTMVGAIAGGILFGLLSDRFGRRGSMIAALVCAMFVIPLWALSPSMSLLLTGGFLMQFMVQGAWGIIPAHLTELSPDSVRGFLPGFAYQCGVLLAGSVAYIQAIFAAKTSYPTTMALTSLTVLGGAILITALGREQRGIRFGDGQLVITE